MLKVEHNLRATANEIIKDPFFNDIKLHKDFDIKQEPLLSARQQAPFLNYITKSPIKKSHPNGEEIDNMVEQIFDHKNQNNTQ